MPLDRKPTSLQQVKNLLHFNQHVSITFDAHDRIVACRKFLDDKLANPDNLYYGINTGFGYLQNHSIAPGQIIELQQNLLMSHACGMGEEVPVPIVKLMLAFKIKSLCYGNSGVQIQTVNRLMDMYNNDMLPVIYKQGSLGASGDLAPLSHLCLPLVGKGEVWLGNKRMPAADALDTLGWQALQLNSKEGIALINGTQFMTAYGLHSILIIKRCLQWANTIAAMSFDAFNCNMQPLHPNIHAVRPHQGQVATAHYIRKILKGSEIADSKGKEVQDPYSFRCVPQVHGASADVLKHAEDIFIKEINSVTDNPLIFAEDNLILSGGNFHGQPLAMCADYLALAAAELGNISERRTYQLLSGQRDLPLFLVKQPGLHSGLMIPQYTAASIVSENKQLCTPASIDSIPSSNAQEDHVSMGAAAVVKLHRVAENLQKILAIELLTATQGLDFRLPAKTSPYLHAIKNDFRKQVSFNEADRVLADDLAAAYNFLHDDPAAI